MAWFAGAGLLHILDTNLYALGGVQMYLEQGERQLGDTTCRAGFRHFPISAATVQAWWATELTDKKALEGQASPYLRRVRSLPGNPAPRVFPPPERKVPIATTTRLGEQYVATAEGWYAGLLPPDAVVVTSSQVPDAACTMVQWVQSEGSEMPVLSCMALSRLSGRKSLRQPSVQRQHIQHQSTAQMRRRPK